MRVCAMAFVLMSGAAAAAPEGVLVEAESFADRGGWSVDQQFVDRMGSPFLLAHGLGRPVADAVTSVELAPGTYRLWVRTRDWCRPMAESGPGRFAVLVDGRECETYGVGGSGAWEWTRGPEVEVPKPVVELRLRDLTGFEGRVDALFFAKGGSRPPETAAQRRALLSIGAPERRDFELVVVGGGLAGVCAAVSAAREGLNVALVQDRGLFGGNASSEVRVPTLGKLCHGRFPRNGEIIREILERFADRTLGDCAGDRWRLRDEAFAAWLASTPNLAVFAWTRAYGVEKDASNAITAVFARHVLCGNETVLRAPLFVDATGDGALAVYAGAEVRTSPEPRSETGEEVFPDGRGRGCDYGGALGWVTRVAEADRPFPDCPWALRVEKLDDALLAGEEKGLPRGGWNWETGFWEDNIGDGELVRDRLLRGIYGTWDFTKNRRADRARFAKSEIYWCGYVLGKRAARRIVGDHVLTEGDLVRRTEYPDGVVTTDWYIDLHFPHPVVERTFGRETFRSTAYDAGRAADRVDTNRFVGGYVKIEPYEVPYRCFYSRNVPNLFMAGKDISATHVAMGSIRVMNTCAAMGTMVGRAAAVCRERNCRPRGLSEGEALAALLGRLK